MSPIRSLLVALALTCTSLGTAGITLLDESRQPGTVTFRLQYQPRSVEEGTIRQRVALPEGAEGDFALLAEASLNAAPRDCRMESALLAVPGMGEFLADDWNWLVDGDVSVGLEPVTLSGVAGVRVYLKPLGNDTTARTVVVEGRVKGDGGRGTGDGGRGTGVFLNAESARGAVVERRFLRGGAPSPALPFKSMFDEGRQGSILVLSEGEASDTPRVEHRGVVLPVVALSGGGHGVYIPRRDDSTSEFDALFVEKDAASPSPEAASRAAFTTLSAGGGEVEIARSRLYNEDVIYDRAVPLPIGERFVYYRATTDQTKDTPLHIEDLLTTDTVHLDIRVASVNTAGNSQEHYARFSIVEYGDFTEIGWAGRTVVDHGVTFPYPGGVERSAPSTGGTVAGRTLTFRHKVLSDYGGIPVSLQALESVKVTWQGKPRLNAAGFCLLDVEPSEDGQPRLLTIGGFPAGTQAGDVLLLDVTAEAMPVLLTGAAVLADDTGTVAVQFEAPGTACSFFAQRFTDLPAGATLVPSKALPDVPGGVLRGIYVRPAELAAALAPLVAHRGEGFIELDPEAAYDHYGHGQESPEAVRLALADLVARAEELDGWPSVVLVGHATFDPHNHLGLKAGAQVPTYVEESLDSGFTIENCIDYPYGLLVGTDNLQDAMVGRLPAKTAEQLTIMVDRIIAHDGLAIQLADTLRPAVFVTDDDLAPTTPGEDPWPPYWIPTGRPYEQIIDSTASNGEAERAAIKAALERGPAGPALLYYFGHGNYNVWSNESLLNTAQLAGINTASKWPLVVTFTCFNGYYAFPGQAGPSLGEAWLLEGNNRGTAANIAPSSVESLDGNRLYSEIALALLSLPQGTRPKTVGEFLTQARINFEIAYPEMPKTNNVYLLFGDPLTSLTLDGPGTAFVVR